MAKSFNKIPFSTETVKSYKIDPEKIKMDSIVISGICHVMEVLQMSGKLIAMLETFTIALNSREKTF